MFNNYRKIKNRAYREYKAVGQVRCPYLNREIVFNSAGFRHLIYKGGNIKRDSATQMLRFRLIRKAAALLAITATVQEKDLYKSKIYIKKHGRRIKQPKSILYLGFIAIIDGWKIKVIVKKIGEGNYFFWSVIPNWVTNRKRDRGKKYVNFTGNLEED
jgi:hypothetical protein